jgi:2-keto-3-deoxy-L-rhamnonate aldolase RhmA
MSLDPPAQHNLTAIPVRTEQDVRALVAAVRGKPEGRRGAVRSLPLSALLAWTLSVRGNYPGGAA